MFRFLKLFDRLKKVMQTSITMHLHYVYIKKKCMPDYQNSWLRWKWLDNFDEDHRKHSVSFSSFTNHPLGIDPTFQGDHITSLYSKNCDTVTIFWCTNKSCGVTTLLCCMELNKKLLIQNERVWEIQRNVSSESVKAAWTSTKSIVK